MSYPPSLCIDLGASFTKVAYRPRPDATTHLLKDPDLTYDTGRFCIPSVAARNKATGVWVFGAQAMDLRGGGRVEVFHNWKADLFVPPEERTADVSVLEGASPEVSELLLDAHPHLRAMDVAARYLCWLYDEQLPAMLGSNEFTRAQVQLCVPEFVRDDASFMAILDRVMAWAGFRNSGGYALSEPRANLVGILTSGHNIVARSGRPDLGAMLGDADILRALSKPDQTVLFVDIGAYTTDLALVSLALHQGGGFTDAPSRSARLGVRHLDELVLAEAVPEERAAVEASAQERETLHDKYSTTHFAGGDPFAIYGLSTEGVDRCTETFAAKVLREIRSLLDECTTTVPFAAVLTGGGCNIPAVGNRVAGALAELGVRWFHVPEGIVAPPSAMRNVLRDELVRGASAIGGASILFA